MQILGLDNILDDFEPTKVKDWMITELKLRSLPQKEGWKLIVETFHDRRKGFSEPSIRLMLNRFARQDPDWYNYRNNDQVERVKHKKIKQGKTVNERKFHGLKKEVQETLLEIADAPMQTLTFLKRKVNDTN